MDMPALKDTVDTAWIMLQPYLPVIATKAAEKLGSELPVAVGKLWTSLRTRMEAKKEANTALAELLQKTEDKETQAVFKWELRKILEEDEGYRAELKALLQDAAPATYQVGDGALAVGENAKAVGAGGVMIEGGVKGDYLGAGAHKEETPNLNQPAEHHQAEMNS